MSNTAQQLSDKAQAGNIKLAQANLPAISNKIKTPAYDRSMIKTGILHISVGGFHRSHQAVYLDKLFGQNDDVTDWGIYGVSAMPNDRQLYTNLSEQDYLYSVLTMSQNGVEPQIIGSIIDGCFAPENPQTVIKKIADNDIKIVSLTITEWGYYFDANGNLDKNHPDVKHDLDNPDAPKTALFLIVKGLQQRQQEGGKKITLLSCDNLQENGHVLEKIIGQIADMIAPEIKGWIAENITFPNSMVDRITPVFNIDDVSYLADQYQLEDHCPVRCEPFIQWVIEDNFAAGRPPLEEVGVQFVENVAAYEKMKIRLLNANHSALCYLGYLFGHRYVHEVAQDADMKVFMRHVMDEMTPTLDPVPGINVEEYKDILIERFSNPKIADTLLRICNGGSEKFPKFFFAALEILMKDKGIMPKYSAMAMAGWIRFLQGTDEQGQAITIEDPAARKLIEAAGNSNPVEAVFNLNDSYQAMKKYPDLVLQIKNYLSEIHKKGAKKAVQDLI